jgi:hypothetical protein
LFVHFFLSFILLVKSILGHKNKFKLELHSPLCKPKRKWSLILPGLAILLVSISTRELVSLAAKHRTSHEIVLVALVLICTRAMRELVSLAAKHLTSREIVLLVVVVVVVV